MPSYRHTDDDLRLWAEYESGDRAHGQFRLAKITPTALWEIRCFAERGPLYCSVSWGKDSVAMADLVLRHCEERRQSIPLIWVRVEPISNPHCADVRDEFLKQWPKADYHEIETWCHHDAAHEHAKEIRWIAGGTLERGFKLACERFGTERRISGVRGDESGTRTISARAHGISTAQSCRPLLWWGAADVFAYLEKHRLPVHPNYAMLGGGRYEREHLRVASLGGTRGAGMDRATWEKEYYGDILRRLQVVKKPTRE